MVTTTYFQCNADFSFATEEEWVYCSDAHLLLAMYHHINEWASDGIHGTACYIIHSESDSISLQIQSYLFAIFHW